MPEQSPLQSLSSFGVNPVFPPAQTPQSSSTAVPKNPPSQYKVPSIQSPAQSAFGPVTKPVESATFGSNPVLPKEHTPQSSLIAVPKHSP